MLNVLQLIPTLDRSGAEKQMVMLAKGLPRDRFRVEVAALTRLGPLAAELRAANIPLTLIGKPWKVDLFALGRLTRFLKKKKFDVVQTWVFAANSYGRMAAKRAKVPVVITSEMAVDLWKGPGHLAIDRRLAKWCDKLVGNSHAVVDYYRTRARVPEDRLAMIYSGIDDEPPPSVDRATVRGAFGWPSEAPLFVFIGRLMPQKAVGDFIDALDLLQHVRPDARTLIIGGGPQRKELEETAHAYKLDDRVRFLGHRDDVPRILAAADCLVLPSRYEGLPNVVLEAMQYKKPVVATAAPGTTEVVVDGVTGLLVPIGNPQALAKALRTIVDEPERARAMGEAGYLRVREHFSEAAMIDHFATLYESIARSKGMRV